MIREGKDADFDERTVAQRRDEAIRRALNTPPKPTKELVGTTERAQDQQKVKKARQAKPKSP